MNHLHKEAWREAVRSGDLDRWPHPGGCMCRECAVEGGGSMNLIDFLRQRLDEDEAAAEACPPWPWRLNPDHPDEVLAADGIGVTEAFALSSRQTRATAAHIARWDPARVLAEVEAKRAILSRWTSDAQFPDFHGGYEEAMNDAALALAQPYADHPDFDPAWLLVRA